MDISRVRTRLRAAVAILLTAGALAAHWLYPELWQTVWLLLRNADIQASVEFLRSYGSNAALVSFLIIVLINTLGVFPNIFILSANGVIFGVVEGTLISWAGECVGSAFSFWLLRYFGRDYAEQMIDKCGAFKEIDKMSGKSGFQIMLIARAVPYMPAGLVTALGAISSMSFRDYMLATAIGKIPSAWLEVTVGHDAMAYKEHMGRLILILLISAAAYGLVWWYRKYRLNTD